jgi:hypothetical protein
MSEVTLDGLLDRLAAVNPFLDNRVNGPAPPGDVSEIHHAAFERLAGLARQALAAGQGLGAVLWGEAGVGKSHLLGRLARWADAGNARLVYVHNLQAAPDALPRSLLRAAVAALTGGRRQRFAGTPLYYLARAGLIEAAGGAGRFGWSYLEHAFQRWLDALAPQAGNRLVYEVLFSFFHSAARAGLGREDGSVAGLAARWLAGGALDPAEARLLGLPPARHRDEPSALEGADDVRAVLAALARLARAERRPLVLALDQVDNLDEEQFAALTRFLEALLDAAPGLLVVTTGIQDTLRRWHEERVVQSSAWDRLAQFTVQLYKLTPAQAEELVRRRLDDFLAPFAGLEELGRLRKADGLFPLGRAWSSRQLLHRSEVRPRDAVSLARDGWQAQQERLGRLGGPAWLAGWPGDGEAPAPPPAPAWNEEQENAAIDQAVAAELGAARRRFHAEPASLPADPDRLAGLLYDLLGQYRQAGAAGALAEVRRVPPPRPGAPPTYHLSLARRPEEGGQVTGVLVMATEAKQSVAGFLRRLCEDSRPLDRVVVVTDERTGMPLGEKGQEYLSELLGRGPARFAVVELSFGERAELEALAGVVARARSGDVEIELAGVARRALGAAEVAESLRRQGLYAGQRLLADLLGPAEPAEALAGGEGQA